MAVIFLAGGRGTRMGSRTSNLPKPMIPVGDKPILEHLLNWFQLFGHRDFCVAAGYRGEDIEAWAAQLTQMSRVENGHLENDGSHTRITVLDTGIESQTGERLRKCLEHLPKERHIVTYGDGLGDVDIHRLLDFHAAHGKLVTVTAVQPPARFGRLEMQGDRVVTFGEKVQELEGWINGGFFVLEPGVKEYLGESNTPFEREPLEALATAGELMAFRHRGFWHPMDTERDNEVLNTLWASGAAPWTGSARSVH